jgi:hypothetical protein
MLELTDTMGIGGDAHLPDELDETRLGHLAAGGARLARVPR